MLIKTVALFMTITAVFACEMDCRRGVSQNFAVYYMPVVQSTVDSLESQLSSSIQRISIPSTITKQVSDEEILGGVQSAIYQNLRNFVGDDTLKAKLAQGFYQVIFNEALPYKGDCNNPKRLTRKMPPAGESWTMEECEKMDYRCGNPPSICHFLDDVKQRCIGRMRKQLGEYASYENGTLVRSLVRDTRKSVYSTLARSEQSAADKSVDVFVTKIVSSIISTLDKWVTIDVAQICETPEQEEAYMSSDHHQNSLKQALFAGACAGTAVDTVLFPLDTIKTRLQSQHGFIASGGFRGIYSGLLSAVIGSSPNASLFFVTYEGVKRVLGTSTEYTPLIHMAAASCGETVACTIRVPTEVIKQRMQTKQFNKTSAAVSHVLRTEGILGMYRGFLSTVSREIPFTCIQFPLYEYFKRTYAAAKGRRTEPYEAAMMGSVAGGIAAAVTTPLDVCKTRIMLSHKNQSSGKHYSGIVSTMKRIASEEGTRALFSGIGPRVMWISIGGKAKTPSVATWQPHFITQCIDWCVYIETELALLSEQECEQILALTQQQTLDTIPTLTELLDALHCFFQLLLQNTFLSNSLYFYIMKNYQFLTIPENDILVKDLTNLAQEAATKNILKEMLDELHK
ncbi:hypothetical protein G6F16_007028 [Rhizopus arrhizus]|nr:hypothetical protein G6F23_003825 [Rhizopus arrhizus]KAG0760896.1 hypothetical protein G6F24_007969 [Rhizopus arrhizus]KAG0787336.1 hypothetical protein G6F21_007970 [Rhizopus arrhizus]KAG0811659.1 hypothetical protein G6F20_006993 [Rhizopus arrhizus]KAG0830651.1 hypothetical protein G6F19_007133 [Rhizopus arrhizus]